MNTTTEKTHLKPWKLHQLRAAMQRDLAKCTSPLERGCAAALCKKEIREKAQEIARKRKLTPGEQAILEEVS